MTTEQTPAHKSDRDALEWLVYTCLSADEPLISFGRGKELLRFKYMDEMREWYNNITKRYGIK